MRHACKSVQCNSQWGKYRIWEAEQTDGKQRKQQQQQQQQQEQERKQPSKWQQDV